MTKARMHFLQPDNLLLRLTPKEVRHLDGIVSTIWRHALPRPLDKTLCKDCGQYAAVLEFCPIRAPTWSSNLILKKGPCKCNREYNEDIEVI